MTPSDLARINAAIPPKLPMPASVPAVLAIKIEWASLSPIARLVIARLFGRSADRDAVAAAWDEARDLGLTIRNLAESLPPSPLRTAALAKIQYANKHRI